MLVSPYHIANPDAQGEKHPLVTAITSQHHNEVKRLLLEGRCGPNDRFLVVIKGRGRFRRPLELAVGLSSSVCLHASVCCTHCDCLLANSESLLHLLIRLGANINFHNSLIDHAILFGPTQTLYDEDVLSLLCDHMQDVQCNQQQWDVIRWLYAKDEHLLLDTVRGCIENGLQWDSRIPTHCAVTRTVLVRAVRWFLEVRLILHVLLNLWLCGFALARPGIDLLAVSEFQVLPEALQKRAFSLAAKALAIVKGPMKLELQARSCIRKKLPLATFRSSTKQLRLPTKLQSFILFAERF